MGVAASCSGWALRSADGSTTDCWPPIRPRLTSGCKRARPSPTTPSGPMCVYSVGGGHQVLVKERNLNCYHVVLCAQTIVELQPKTLFSASPRSEPDVADRRSYCLIVKFSPHSSDNVEVRTAPSPQRTRLSRILQKRGADELTTFRAQPVVLRTLVRVHRPPRTVARGA